MKKLLLSVLIISASMHTFSQNRAHDINDKLGRGVNFGNMFESPRSGGWGAEVPEYFFEEIAEKGFNSIRVPIKWSDYALTEAPYTIEQEFIDTIKTVVDLALKNKLMVVINMHHYDEIFDDPDGHTERFLAIWDQISREFQDYPDSLLFELLNEPHSNLNQAKWDALFPIALDTVRADNPTRKVVIGPPDWNGIGAVDKIAWPENDTNLIMTVHYYNPFQFTHQGASWVDGADAWLGTTWDSTASQMQAVINDFAKARTFAETKNVPVYVGEFGSYSTADMDSRKKWTAYLARTIESFGFSWAYWEFSSGFGIYDPGDGIWKNELLNALTEQTDPNSIPLETWEISNSGFSRGFLGWDFWVQGGAEATVNVINEEAFIDIALAGDQSWHIQLVQAGLSVVRGAEYRFSFDAKSEEPFGIIIPSIGKNSDPYNGYSGSHSYTLTGEMTNYAFTFTMNDPSDPVARAVFNLSNVATSICFDNILLERLSTPIPVEQLTIGPEPAEITAKEGALQLTAAIEPQDATFKTVTWTVVSGQTLATVTSQGVVKATGLSDGTAKIRASATDDSGIYSDISVDISNQTVGAEAYNVNSFNAWATGQVIHYTIPESLESRSISLYSIDGRKIYSETLPLYATSGNISQDQSENNIFILELIDSDSRKTLKIVRRQ